jgi:diaminopimelate decarboxylase
MSVTELRQLCADPSTGTIARVPADPLLALFPDTATVDGGALTIGGVPAADLVAAHGSPLVVYDDATLRANARAYRDAAPGALVVYGTKAFPNVALLRLLAGEGIGADVSTLGELRFAQAAGIAGDHLVMHGNNKSDDELRAAAEAGALVVVDSHEEVDRARAAGATRTLVRVTPGVEADTHEHIRTGHHGSKFGLPPDDALEALRRAPETEGIHAHVGSQLMDPGAALMAVDWLATFAARARAETGGEARTIDLGGGLGVATSPDETQPDIGAFVRALVAELNRACELHGLSRPQVILEPGRSLVARAGVTLYTVGSVKRASATTTYVAVDGGISDNPRPALYGARYTALLANRADETPAAPFAVAGKHCESGDLLIDRVELPEPRRGDVLAVPATGGYTLAMSSNYNAVPRPAAVLVRDGAATPIRRRETIDDLLALEA